MSVTDPIFYPQVKNEPLWEYVFILENSTVVNNSTPGLSTLGIFNVQSLNVQNLNF